MFVKVNSSTLNQITDLNRTYFQGKTFKYVKNSIQIDFEYFSAYFWSMWLEICKAVNKGSWEYQKVTNLLQKAMIVPFII